MNVCLIILDDVGLDLLSSSHTPVIDRLVTAGTVYDRFVAAPSCSNFRAKVETGYYSIRPENWVGGIFRNTTSASLPTDNQYLLAKRVPNADQVGKWHLCAHSDLHHRARCGYWSSGGPQANLNGESYYDWEAVIDGQPQQITEYATDWTADRAVDRLMSGHEYVEIAFNAVHSPLEAPPGFTDGTEQAMLEYLDGALERVIQAALARGYAILLCSDNGGSGTSGGKGNLSQGAIGTLLVAYNAPVYPASVVDTTDLYATIVELVTGAGPGTWGDGISLANPSVHREIAFADRFLAVLQPPGPKWYEMATDGDLKVIRRPASGVLLATDWHDDPTMQDVSHLIAALDAR